MKFVIQLMAVFVIILSAFFATAGTQGNEIDNMTVARTSEEGGIRSVPASATASSDTEHSKGTSHGRHRDYHLRREGKRCFHQPQEC